MQFQLLFLDLSCTCVFGLDFGLWTSFEVVMYVCVCTFCRQQIKKKDEDIAVCECKLDPGKTELACGERCLNVLTNTECTPGYCPCGTYCNNQVHYNFLLFSFFL